MTRIGIRREDKSRWEARTPLVPADIQRLIKNHGLEFTVQSSPIRAFPEEEFRAVGAKTAEALADCPIIMGVKEIPSQLFEKGKTYVFFAHVIKGQPKNMPMLRRLMDLGCQLIDYEKITDDKGRRLVFFGHYAGLAGMIDTLWALGRRLEHEGIANPFTHIEPAHQYRNLEHVQEEIQAVADAIRSNGLPQAIRPFVCGFAGYGKVSQGAQEIFDLLPMVEIEPEDLPKLQPSRDQCYKVVFHEEHMVQRVDTSQPFELQEYYQHPERYRPTFFQHVPYLSVLVNCIYWEPKYPRLIDAEQFRALYCGSQQPRLRVVGDISCDIDGSVACTARATSPDNPIYVFEPDTGRAIDGVAGRGPVVLAVDFLPCELPVDASAEFSRALTPFMPALANADFTGTLAGSGLPPELAKATILLRGKLTESYAYLAEHVAKPAQAIC
jgi:saccharopine dehydrogenase (NAD+, L-lysine forming)